jgi:hypothetical protein
MVRGTLSALKPPAFLEQRRSGHARSATPSATGSSAAGRKQAQTVLMALRSSSPSLSLEAARGRALPNLKPPISQARFSSCLDLAGGPTSAAVDKRRRWSGRPGWVGCGRAAHGQKDRIRSQAFPDAQQGKRRIFPPHCCTCSASLIARAGEGDRAAVGSLTGCGRRRKFALPIDRLSTRGGVSQPVGAIALWLNCSGRRRLNPPTLFGSGRHTRAESCVSSWRSEGRRRPRETAVTSPDARSSEGSVRGAP